MPWQLPAVLVLGACAMLFAIWQPPLIRSSRAQALAEEGAHPHRALRRAGDGAHRCGRPPTPSPSPPIATEPPTPANATASATLGLTGDPLDDPTVGSSRLERANRITLLLLGTDGRDEEDGPPRTDLMIVAVLDRKAQRATMVSIPRDLWVPIPDYGEGKANTAYFLGSLEDRGTELARETVEALFDLPIDHTIQIDFNGFRTLVDQMGGVELDVPEAIDDPQYPDGNYGTIHLQIPAGPQQMDGETALRYARTRYGGLDQDRSVRQQSVLLAIRERALQPAQLANAPFLLRTAYRTIESDLSLGDLFALARLGRGLEGSDITMHTLQADSGLVWPILTWNGQDALMYDARILRQTVEGWIQGRP